MHQNKTHFETMKSTIRERLNARRQLLNPFKLDPIKHMQRHALTDDEWAALRKIEGNPQVRSIVRRGWNVELKEDPRKKRNLPYQRFKIMNVRADETEWWMVDVAIEWERLPDKVRDYIVYWLEYEYKLRDQNLRAYQHVKAVGDAVRTWGQLHKVWPSLLPLMPPEQKSKLMYRRGKSKLDNEVTHHYDNNGQLVLKDIFTDARIEATDMVLAEMMLLYKGAVEHPRMEVVFQDGSEMVIPSR